ncbi:MAG: ribonuclease III [Leptospiraceae bacterium]|nr:ribonuclease III [Leptospiraceae bacterium]
MPAQKSSDLFTIEQFLNQIGLSSQNLDHYQTALTHRSYSHEQGETSSLANFNQRLEFLGDAILGAVIAEYLFTHNPQWEEGDLTQAKAGIVCEASLHEIAVRLKLGNMLRLGKGEESNGGRERPSILADALEAFIGAVYLQGGWHTASEFIIEQFSPLLSNGQSIIAEDYKSSLQIYLSKVQKTRPEYKIINAKGPDHERIWTVALYVQGNLVAQASDRSRKKAEQRAAAVYLQQIRNNQ